MCGGRKLSVRLARQASSAETLRQIIEAGADVLRLNFSHGTP